MSVAPPQLDKFFAADEAPLRANEFAALVWSEEQVWRRSTVFSLLRRTTLFARFGVRAKVHATALGSRRDDRPIYFNRLR
jgi:hypothetical protein